MIGDAAAVAVVGPGLMGLGIARVTAAAGLRVVLVGRDGAAASAGRQRLAEQLAREVDRGRLGSGAADALLARVTAAADDGALAACGLAVETVAEDRAVKVAVLQRLQWALPPDALIATNTSGLPIGGLARALEAPGRFIGLHFFSPVDRMPLVEVVRGAATSPATLRDALAFVRRIGQQPVVVRDGPGFFASRVFCAYLDEALAMVGEGVAPQRIESAALAGGRLIGPLAVIDDISIALNWQQVLQARADGLTAERCRPLAAPVLERMVGQWRLGRRQGGGFLDAGDSGARLPWPGLAALFPPAAVQPDADEVGHRLRAAEAIEALRCVEQGVVASADDADTASVLGLGFPRASGGVLRWVESVGLDRFVAGCDALAARHGPRFAPSAALCEAAALGLGLARWRVRTANGAFGGATR